MLRTALALCISLSYTTATSCMWGYSPNNFEHAPQKAGDTPEQWMKKLSTAYRTLQTKTACQLIEQNPRYVQSDTLQVFHTLACTEFVIVPSILAKLVEAGAPIGACPLELLKRETMLISMLMDQVEEMQTHYRADNQKHINNRKVVINALLTCQAKNHNETINRYALLRYVDSMIHLQGDSRNNSLLISGE